VDIGDTEMNDKRKRNDWAPELEDDWLDRRYKSHLNTVHGQPIGDPDDGNYRTLPVDTEALENLDLFDYDPFVEGGEIEQAAEAMMPEVDYETAEIYARMDEHKIVAVLKDIDDPTDRLFIYNRWKDAHFTVHGKNAPRIESGVVSRGERVL
jgi:hypothetical protein